MTRDFPYDVEYRKELARRALDEPESMDLEELRELLDFVEADLVYLRDNGGDRRRIGRYWLFRRYVKRRIREREPGRDPLEDVLDRLTCPFSDGEAAG